MQVAKRYFHVAYSHSTGFGMCQTIVNKDEFLNLNKFKKDIELQGAKNIVVINVLEMNEDDFLDFIS